ncbi:MAG TPA: YHYH protein [Candidatus Pristimantibacillus sp.]|jgi:hypothetical protein|nr:YHYH protein [Candidatus Pristimantibacillus sp.]
MPEDQNNQGELKPDEQSDAEMPMQPVVVSPAQPNKRIWLIAVVAAVLVFGGAGAAWFLTKGTNKQSAQTPKISTNTQTNSESAQQANTAGLKLDPTKNYGDKYANGLLPVGDNKYVTDGAKKGYVYVCNANFVPASQAGAQVRGPWFTNNNTQWDINKKVAVQGNVMWQQNITVKIENGKRVVTTNDLPDHHTGTFPIASSDPAYQYDRNPGTITTQTLAYNLAASPSYGAPQCMGGEVGVMTTGVALFDAFDAGGRDAGAWEVQDSCDGHPQNKGEYHYHTLSRCIKDTSVQTVIGYALDGFPITGPKVGDKNFLTTNDLDECHGIVSDIMLDGKKVTSYHYVMTEDFPYSVSCFRAAAIQPPGQHETTGGTPSGQQAPPPGGPKPY